MASQLGQDTWELRKYFIPMVSLYCGECVGTDIDVTAGFWAMGYPASSEVGVRTLESSQTGWPQDVPDWQYVEAHEWHSDPNLTVTGKE